MTDKLHIKNMVCPRCITAVEDTLREQKIDFTSIQLGQVVLKNSIDKKKTERLSKRLEEQGFELLSSQKSQLIEQIKTTIINQIHYSKEPLSVTFSAFLSEQLQADYASLSRLFSATEGITIERYIVRQKIEHVKELLFYDELSLAAIADQLNYNSVAYLSSIFKKETGQTISAFKKMHEPGHESYDEV